MGASPACLCAWRQVGLNPKIIKLILSLTPQEAGLGHDHMLCATCWLGCRKSRWCTRSPCPLRGGPGQEHAVEGAWWCSAWAR